MIVFDDHLLRFLYKIFAVKLKLSYSDHIVPVVDIENTPYMIRIFCTILMYQLLLEIIQIKLLIHIIGKEICI